ncbi:MAG TPA: ABC transporter substrate-binding protein, partial [Elusimicrobiales bacterium]|nr:ABC transporter substrate-binding protein [Elusimicrobiales bacterium]
PFPATRGFMMLVAVLMLVALWLLLTRTRIGLVIQAALTHPEMVESLGHNVPRVFMLVFGAGTALAGLAGADNIFAGEKAGYFQASWETVVEADPAVIVCPGGDAAEIKARPMAGRLRAVRSGAVLCGLDRDLFARLTPSSPSAVKALREALDEFR